MSSLRVGLDFISFLCRSGPRSSSRAGRAGESAGRLLPPSGGRRKRRCRAESSALPLTIVASLGMLQMRTHIILPTAP